MTQGRSFQNGSMLGAYLGVWVSRGQGEGASLSSLGLPLKLHFHTAVTPLVFTSIEYLLVSDNLVVW